MVPAHAAFCTRTHARMLFTEPHTESMWVAEEKLDLKYTEPVGSLWENLPDFAARV